MAKELVFKDLVFKICDCNRYLYKNKWVKFEELDDAIEDFVRDNANQKLGAVKVHLGDFDIKPGIKKDIKIEVKLKKDIFDLPCRVEVITCPKCSKQGTQYFEGILQLRSSNEEVLSKAHAYVMDDSINAKAKGVFINNVEDVKNGVDVYYSSQKYIKNLGSRLVKQFGGILKVTPTLFSHNKQTSKDLYRVTVAVHFPDFIIGDVIKVDKKIIKLTGLGKKASGIDLKTNKQEVFELKDYEILKKYKTTVSRLAPDLEVLHPETYQSVEVWNSKKNLKLDQEVEVVVDKDVFIL